MKKPEDLPCYEQYQRHVKLLKLQGKAQKTVDAGYTRLRRDIIQMLTNEQVGSVYSRGLVLAAMFCLAATALPVFGYKPSLFVYVVDTVLTLLSALALVWGLEVRDLRLPD